MWNRLWKFKVFFLLVILGAAVDLHTKALVFQALGVQGGDIQRAVEKANLRHEQEMQRYAELRQRHEAQRGAGMTPVNDLPEPSEPRLYIGLPRHHQYEVTANRLYFTAVLNAGAFGGMLGGQITMLIVLAVVAVGIVCWVLLRLTKLQHQISCGLIVAGAIGNIYDRVTFGCVRDFVDFRWPETGISWLNPWNTFNFADSCIVLGMAALLILELFFSPAPPKLKPAATPAPEPAPAGAPPAA